MSLFRIEVDQHGKRTEIPQTAYQTPDGVQVVDSVEVVPDSWVAFTPDPAPDAQQLITMFRDSIQLKLDEQARQYGYDSIASAVTYADEPAVPKFQAEGQAFRAWRSLVWAYGYEQLALVESGQRPAPTIPEFIAELPPLDLPAPITAGQE